MGEHVAWPVILALGVWHGMNPGMGWLFAVALGMQERGSGAGARAVWRALPPIALGHAIAVAGAVALAGAVGLVIPLAALRWITALALVGAGIYRLRGHRHGRYFGMRVDARALMFWSMLMASAHGAGLMVVPFVLGGAAPAGGHAAHMASMIPAGAGDALGATAIHTAGYLVTTGVIAALVYAKLGLQFLRRAWVNLDVIWAGALIATGMVTALL